MSGHLAVANAVENVHQVNIWLVAVTHHVNQTLSAGPAMLAFTQTPITLNKPAISAHPAQTVTWSTRLRARPSVMLSVNVREDTSAEKVPARLVF